MRIGILTGGGDAPGLNGVVEATTRVLLQNGIEVVGIRDGFEGIFDSKVVLLRPENVQGSHALAGSLLGASNKSRIKGREKEFLQKYKALRLDGLIALGGDGTFAALSNVYDEESNSSIKLIGVPKTIDNDLAGTEFTFGYDTACGVVAEAVESLRATAETHSRIFVVETMGRTSGWIALGGGLAAYADAILLPEFPFDRDGLVEFLKAKKANGQRGLVIVVAEGSYAKGDSPSVHFQVKGSPQPERYGGFSFELSRFLEERTQWESRNLVLGHLQRSRFPTTTDRFLTLSMGVRAAHMALSGQWGQAVVYRQGQVIQAPLKDLMQPARLIQPDHHWLTLAQSLDIWPFGHRRL